MCWVAVTFDVSLGTTLEVEASLDEVLAAYCFLLLCIQGKTLIIGYLVEVVNVTPQHFLLVILICVHDMLVDPTHILREPVLGKGKSDPT